jgi:hypothetical protein
LWGRGRGWSGWQGRGWGQGGEMTQALYAHMNNKRKMKKKKLTKKKKKMGGEENRKEKSRISSWITE